MDHTYPPPTQRRLITLFTVAAAFMTQLDATIANVALPHMQASTSASREQITWVLTSYIIMAAIFTPLSGTLATRFGRKRIMVLSVTGFTVASMLCGISANFGQLIGFRLLQGTMGAALLPMSQAILLDINPPEDHGRAMAAWGVGAVLGPIIGPVLGGYLTDYFSWRWIFFINLPFGLASGLGLLVTLHDVHAPDRRPIDLFGFALLAVSIGGLQLVLDRGQISDWFQSREIWIETAVCATAFYLFLVHTFTTRRPFVNPALFRDRNYVLGNFYGFILGGLMYGVMALTPPMLAGLFGYPIRLIGIVSAPRGITTMISMLLVGRVLHRLDVRLVIFVGLLICGLSMHMMAGLSLAMDERAIVIPAAIQGIGAGMVFVPITTVVFATIAPSYRNEGAAVNSLIRNLSGSIWISVLQTLTIRNAATVQSRLAEGMRPDNPVFGLLPDMDFTSPLAAIGMNAEVARQATMVAYVDSFWVICVACLLAAPLVVFLRR